VAEDLLDEMEEGGDGNGRSSGMKMRLKRLLGNKKRLIIFFLAIVLVLSSAAGGWFLFFSGDGDDTGAEPTVTQQDAIQADSGQEEEIIFEDIVVLEPFERIPLKSGSTMGLISLEIALELTDHRYRKQVYTVQDRLSRVVEGRVRQMAWLELRTPEGKIRLKYELLKQMNSIFPKVTIRNIYFINFLMQ